MHPRLKFGQAFHAHIDVAMRLILVPSCPATLQCLPTQIKTNTQRQCILLLFQWMPLLLLPIMFACTSCIGNKNPVRPQSSLQHTPQSLERAPR
eukprot:1451372-Amphidinium_carterae.2